MAEFRNYLELKYSLIPKITREKTPPEHEGPEAEDPEIEKEEPVWTPTKEEVLKHWGQLESEQPIQITPIPKEHKGSSYLQDTIRITGTRKFIDSVLSQPRIKALLEIEEKGLKEPGDASIRVIYRETRDRETGKPTSRYSCYIQIREKKSQ